MTLYLVYISSVYSSKNNLYKAIQKFLKSMDRQMISESIIHLVKGEILSEINHLNKIHPRCKPVIAEFWSPRYGNEAKDFILSFNGDSIICFSLLAGVTNSK